MMKRVLHLTVLLVSVLLPVATATAADKANTGPATCGQTLGQMSAAPSKVAEITAAVAEMFEAHAALMDQGKDEASLAEARGLRAIAALHKQMSSDASKTAAAMKASESWAAAPHDMAKFSSDPRLNAATKKVVAAQKELIALLQKMVADMEAQPK